MTDEPTPIAPEFEKLRTTQRYGGGDAIEGVRLVELKRFVEDGGEFQELARVSASGELPEFPGFRVAQVNYSVMEPGAIKAWHLHFLQEDVWFVPATDRLVVGLHDCRDNSPTKGKTQRMVLGAGRSRLLLIPRGVAHGAWNPGSSPAVTIYFVNRHFDAQAPDEHRLPWDLLGADFWSVKPG